MVLPADVFSMMSEGCMGGSRRGGPQGGTAACQEHCEEHGGYGTAGCLLCLSQ